MKLKIKVGFKPLVKLSLEVNEAIESINPKKKLQKQRDVTKKKEQNTI